MLQGRIPVLQATGTISLWAKFTTLGVDETLFVFGNNWYGDGMILLRKYWSDNKIHFVINSAQGEVVSDIAIVTGRWYYITATYQANDMKLYINGVLQGTDTSCAMASNVGSSYYIGKSNTLSADYFHGSIDEIKYYAVILCKMRLIMI